MPALPEDKLPRNDVRHAAVAADPIRILAEPLTVALYKAPDATLDDLREAVTTLEETTRIARRVFGGAYPLTMGIERELRDARAALAAREDTKIK